MKLPAHATAQEMLTKASNFFQDSRLLEVIGTFETDTLETFDLELEGSSADFLSFGHFEEVAKTDELARLTQLLEEFKETSLLARRKSIILEVVRMMDIC